MNPYVQDYMNISSGQTTWFSSTILACQAVFMPLGGFIASKISYRWVLLAGMLFSSGGILLTSLTVQHGLGPYIATYCICFGIGMGLPYSVIFSIASSWFPNSRATVVGIIASGFGLGALIFIPIQKEIIYSNNLDNIPKAFLILGGIVLGLEIIGTLLLRERPMEKNIDFDNVTDGDMTMKHFSEEKEEISTANRPRSYTVKQALQSIDFYILWFIVFLDIIPVVLLTSTYKIFGLDIGYEENFLTPIATCTSVFNCLGRVFWGFMVDKFSLKCPMMTFLFIWAAVFFSFPYVGNGSKAVGQPLYAIFTFILFFSLSAHFVIIPTACNRIFGPQNMATIYGIIYFATSPSALITASIVSGTKLQGHWIEVYSSCGAACVVALILSLFLRDKDAKCLGFTNRICANACNPCRKGLDVDTQIDVINSEDVSSPPWND
ncbi:unnamed protein product [Hymenolepis diminuta]|nr:unnamed protein product [Hymenolepis diminuta]